jgi:preprotein translocase subunit SecG
MASSNFGYDNHQRDGSTVKSQSNSRRFGSMKKLMTLMLGLAFLTTTVAVSFAQDAPKTEKKSKKKKKSEKKEGETEKKGGSL